MIPYIETPQGLTFVLFGESKTLAHDDNRFEAVREMVYAGDDEYDVQDYLRAREREVERVTRLTPRLEYRAGTVLCDGEPMHNYAVDKLVELIDAKLPCTPLVNFLDKLVQNPSFRVVEHLYEFLEFGKVPLTQEGNFVAYKAIRADWHDIHSGRFDNSIGATPRVQRNAVDEDPDRTCSNGLHVCSFDYLPNFNHVSGGGHVIAVEVNPADVVAIPRDYNNTKMRCCGYKVIAEVTDYYKKNQNILSESPFWGEIEMGSQESEGYRIEFLSNDDGWKLDYFATEEDEARDAVDYNIEEQGWYGARAFRPGETEPFIVRMA